jgi:hypothetical protein
MYIFENNIPVSSIGRPAQRIFADAVIVHACAVVASLAIFTNSSDPRDDRRAASCNLLCRSIAFRYLLCLSKEKEDGNAC